MRLTYLVTATLLLAGCADAPEVPVDPRDQAVRDYIEVAELASQDRFRTGSHDSWSYITDRYAVYSGRDGDYLLQFRRRCVELRNPSIATADERFDNQIRRRVDTLRGCLIEDIYALADGQADELRALPDAPSEGT